MWNLYYTINIAPEQFIEFYQRRLGADLLRDDYLVLVQLCVIYSDYLKADPNTYSSRKPAGMFRTKWMSKTL